MVGKSRTVKGDESRDKSPSSFFEALRGAGRAVSESREHLAAGAIARAVSITLMYPIDTAKTRLQVVGQTGKSLQTAILGEGGPFHGLLPSLAGQVPYGMLVFGSYAVYKRLVTEVIPDIGERAKVAVAACLGDITGSIWLCPSEVLKQQLQRGVYGNTAQAVNSNVSVSGIGSLYQGYSGLLLRDIPFRVSQLFFYEEFRRQYIKKNGDITSLWSFILGAAAGTFAAAITTPLDVIKTRLMTQRVGGVVYTGLVDCVKKTVNNEGIAGLFAGLGPRVLYIAPSNAIFFLVYEQVVRRFGTEPVRGIPGRKGSKMTAFGVSNRSVDAPRLRRPRSLTA